MVTERTSCSANSATEEKKAMHTTPQLYYGCKMKIATVRMIEKVYCEFSNDAETLQRNIETLSISISDAQTDVMSMS